MRIGKRWQQLRRLFAIAVPLVMITVTLPSVAMASGTWVVKNAAGKKIGTVHRVNAKYGVVRSVSGARCGDVARNTETLSLARRIVRGEVWFQMFIRKGYPGLERWTYWDGALEFMTGRIILNDGRWSAESVGDFYHRIGTVDDACPAWLGGGAVFVLRPKMWPSS